MSFDRKYNKAAKRWRREDWITWEQARVAIEHCSMRGQDGQPKIKYYTWEEAEAKRLQQEEKWGITLRIYRCHTCGTLHLTKKPK